MVCRNLPLLTASRFHPPAAQNAIFVSKPVGLFIPGTFLYFVPSLSWFEKNVFSIEIAQQKRRFSHRGCRSYSAARRPDTGKEMSNVPVIKHAMSNVFRK